MRIVDHRHKGGRRHAEPTDDDKWAILMFETGENGDRMTVVGPYESMSRAEEDRESWLADGTPCVMVRLMPPETYEAALLAKDREQFGFAAKVSKDDQKKPKRFFWGHRKLPRNPV